MPPNTERRQEPGRPPGNHPVFDECPAVPADVQALLRCPVCRSELLPGHGELLCAAPACGMRYPVVNHVPVLINEEESLFTIEDFMARRNTTINLSRSRLKQWVDRLLPTLGRNLRAKQNFRLLAGLLLNRSPNPRVLVVGGSILGHGIKALLDQPQIRWLETDVTFGPRTRIICDAHSLPFADNSFDAVIMQAVLQYVQDPLKCAWEIERVLKPRGFIYAETAFMQQVVHGRYDFTRFTHLGLRRLFRSFQEVHSGPIAGPGMALAWACHFFLLSFASKKNSRALIHAIGRLTFFWLKYFDAFLLNKPGTYDAASGFFFLGTRSNRSLTDRELVALYRGAG